MKCPKCGYLGFEAQDRCRNCGYDFSLAPSSPVPELPIKSSSGGDHVGQLDDLSLVAAHDGSELRSNLVVNETQPAHRPHQAQLGAEQDLPLFGPALADDVPLITKPSPPRTPLAVRRATPEVPRLRAAQPRMQALDLGLDTDPSSGWSRVTRSQPAPAPPVPPARLDTPAHPTGEVAGVPARLIAVAIDLMILAVVDAAVIYFTLQICGISAADFGVLPKGPLLSFLLVQNGGYLVAFTIGGQTLGKMAAGIRVVASDSGQPLDVGRACLRTLLWLLLAAPAGLGFLTTILNRDHRGLHDRFAGTRVIRASV